MRWLRLAMGLFVAFQAIQLQSGIMGLLAGLFLFQALSNSGCCGAAACSVPANRREPQKTDEVDFVEIKEPKQN
ncbi:MAG TPA: hypothetical protein VGD90_07170 [Sphingobacteriaceae bacterium]